MSGGYIQASAVVSADGLYRYELIRRWGPSATALTWVMLNPSTADGETDDPTIRRCVGFSKAWGYDGLVVVNLYALRCTKPVHLNDYPDPVGPENERYIRTHVKDGEIVMAAWGATHGPNPGPSKHAVYDSGAWVCSLGTTKDGHPRHPLYVPGSAHRTPHWHKAAA